MVVTESFFSYFSFLCPSDSGVKDQKQMNVLGRSAGRKRAIKRNEVAGGGGGEEEEERGGEGRRGEERRRREGRRRDVDQLRQENEVRLC